MLVPSGDSPIIGDIEAILVEKGRSDRNEHVDEEEAIHDVVENKRRRTILQASYRYYVLPRCTIYVLCVRR